MKLTRTLKTKEKHSLEIFWIEFFLTFLGNLQGGRGVEFVENLGEGVPGGVGIQTFWGVLRGIGFRKIWEGERKGLSVPLGAWGHWSPQLEVCVFQLRTTIR